MSNTNNLYLTPLFDPLWHELEGEYLAYDRASGATHRFDQVTAILLMRLGTGSASVLELIDHVAETLCFEIDDELVAHINEAVRVLQQNHIVNFS